MISGRRNERQEKRSGRGDEHRCVKRRLHAGADGHGGRECQQQTTAQRGDHRCRDACDERDPQHNLAHCSGHSRRRNRRGGQQWVQGGGVSKEVREVAPRNVPRAGRSPEAKPIGDRREKSDTNREPGIYDGDALKSVSRDHDSTSRPPGSGPAWIRVRDRPAAVIIVGSTCHERRLPCAVAAPPSRLRRYVGLFTEQVTRDPPVGRALHHPEPGSVEPPTAHESDSPAPPHRRRSQCEKSARLERRVGCAITFRA